MKSTAHLHCNGDFTIVTKTTAPNGNYNFEFQLLFVAFEVLKQAQIIRKNVCFDYYLEIQISHDADIVPNKFLFERHLQNGESFKIVSVTVGIGDTFIFRIVYQALINQLSINRFVNKVADTAESARNHTNIVCITPKTKNTASEKFE